MLVASAAWEAGITARVGVALLSAVDSWLMPLAIGPTGESWLLR
jgi:hypothetical protein